MLFVAAHLAAWLLSVWHRRLRGDRACALFPAARGGLAARLALRDHPVRSQAGQPRWRTRCSAAHPGDFRRLDPDHLGGGGARRRHPVHPAAAAVSAIGARIANSIPILAADVYQTIFKAVLFGYVVGNGAGFAAAILADRVRLPAPRPAADRQHGVGAADHRHRADHGDLVRLQLGIEGRRRHRHDVLPDAGEHGRPGLPRPATWSAT